MGVRVLLLAPLCCKYTCVCIIVQIVHNFIVSWNNIFAEQQYVQFWNIINAIMVIIYYYDRLLLVTILLSLCYDREKCNIRLDLLTLQTKLTLNLTVRKEVNQSVPSAPFLSEYKKSNWVSVTFDSLSPFLPPPPPPPNSPTPWRTKHLFLFTANFVCNCNGDYSMWFLTFWVFLAHNMNVLE